MFPKNRINIIYRVICLIIFSLVIVQVSSVKTLIILFALYCFFGLCERNFRNIELIIITLFLLWISYLLKDYILFRIMLLINYCFYFLDTSYYITSDEKTISKNEYVRFSNGKKKKEKGLNNIVALYLTVHLVILFIAIMVG